MKIFYVHHALRDIGNPPTQEDGLKEVGIKDANIVADIFEDGKRYMNVKAIYTSPFYRCKETARLINKHLNAPIIEDVRLNEFGSVHFAVKGIKDKAEKETWEECQIRIMEAIKDIVFKYDEKDTVICVTSGVNLTAFICAAYGIKPNSNLPFPLVPSCSPIGFEISRDNFKQ